MDTEMESECTTLINNKLDNLNFHSSMDKFNIEFWVENYTNFNYDNALTDAYQVSLVNNEINAIIILSLMASLWSTERDDYNNNNANKLYK